MWIRVKVADSQHTNVLLHALIYINYILDIYASSSQANWNNCSIRSPPNLHRPRCVVRDFHDHNTSLELDFQHKQVLAPNNNNTSIPRYLVFNSNNVVRSTQKKTREEKCIHFPGSNNEAAAAAASRTRNIDEKEFHSRSPAVSANTRCGIHPGCCLLSMYSFIGREKERESNI